MTTAPNGECQCQSVHAESRIAALAMVEDLQVVGARVASSILDFQRFRLARSIYILPQKDSVIGLSSQSPIERLDRTNPGQSHLPPARSR